MKVLILSEAADTGGVGYQLKRALEAHTAWTATQAVRSLNYIDYPRDVLWPVGDPLPDRLRTAFAEADVVHVMERWDACRAFDGWTDKPLVLHHHGSILRSNWRVLTQGAVELRAERVVSTPDLALIDPGAEWLPNPVDGGDLARRTGRPDRSPRPFTVFHSPTSAMKGTEALERAAAEAGVATDVVRGVPWTVALARKRTADAVFDQEALEQFAPLGAEEDHRLMQPVEDRRAGRRSL